MNNKSYWIYILHCENNSYYTGYTIDLAKRFQSHVNGTGGKYTRSFRPLSIAQSWKIDGNKSRAMQIERFIKKLSRTEKEKIIACPSLLFSALSKNSPKNTSPHHNLED